MGNEEKNGKIVSVINMKGGVGKTTLSIGLSDFLSDLNNCKVLLIDADPQFNSTQALLDNYKSKGYEDPSSEINYYSEIVLPAGKTIYKLFKPQVDMSQAYETPDKEEVIIDLKDNFGMATLFLTKIIRCCECCGVMAPIALDNEHPRI